MALNTYEQALDFWYRRVNFELAMPQPGDFKLGRMKALLTLLGNPHERMRILHVAGSKGKGSTAAMLAAILRQAGYRTGLFTSPHLCTVEERIQVDGEPIGRDELIQLLNQVEQALRSSGQPLEPTFFEIATVLGFLHFVQRRVAATVLEVGLGGRFDSTNVCSPLAALITSISLDHTLQLGDKVASIAREKAGIVKPGRPVISGVTSPEARAVIERICHERGAPLRQLGVDFSYHYVAGTVGNDVDIQPRFQMIGSRTRWPEFELGLLGEHQAANAAVTLACIEQLRQQGWHLPDSAVAAGLATVNWPARMEVMGRRPLLVLDCAHNVASAQALVDTLLSSFPPTRRLLVIACSSDKDLAGIMRILTPHFAHLFLTRYGDGSRSAPPEQLAALLPSELPVSFSLHQNAMAALEAARSQATVDDLICVTGSVFLAGELRRDCFGRESQSSGDPALDRMERLKK
jgi:dihydrofolate synthase / folylpolyglutamate synthase